MKMAEYMKTGDAPIVSPSKEDLALVTQNGKTRNVKLRDMEELFLGTEDLGNAKSIKQNIIDANTQLNAKVNKSSIVNNCSATEEGFVADARQLKYLKEYIDDQLNGSVKKPYTHDTGTDGNTILTPGWHKCQTSLNSPSAGDYYILVINPYNTLIRQVWFGIWVDSGIYTRTCAVNNNWTWSSFKKLENE